MGALVPFRGVVIRRNKKTVTVDAEDDRQWIVAPTLLKLTGTHVLDIAGKIHSDNANKIVAFPKPDRR